MARCVHRSAVGNDWRDSARTLVAVAEVLRFRRAGSVRRGTGRDADHAYRRGSGIVVMKTGANSSRT